MKKFVLLCLDNISKLLPSHGLEKNNFFRSALIIMLLSGMSIANAQTYTTTNVSYTAAGTYTFIAPCGVTSVTVECWGGGGAGGGAITNNPTSGGGGSGGAYTKAVSYAVVPGNTYTVTVGGGGAGNATTTGGVGNSSWFNSATTILAVGGGGGAIGTATATPGAGASAITSGNIGGTVNFYGGAGGTGATTATGGAGGSSAGSAATGVAGVSGTPGTAPTGAGAGAAGQTGNANGAVGSAPGGGGAGARRTSGSRSGGAGGAGQVVLTFGTTLSANTVPTITLGTVTSNSAVLSWTSVSGQTYKVAYSTSATGPFTILTGTSSTTSTSVTLSSLSASTTYYYQVAINCPSLFSAQANFATLCNAVAVPYNEGFEGLTVANTLPSCMAASPTVASGGKTQTYLASATGTNAALFAHAGTKFASVYYSPNAAGYFFSVPLQLTAGVSYTASVYYVTDGVAWPTVGLAYGTSPTIAAMTNTIATVSSAAATTYTQVTGTFIPPTTGVYYVSFYADNTTTNAPNYASFDDFSVVATPLCSGSPTAGTVAPTSASGNCGIAATLLTLSGYTTGVANITLQWQSSPDNITYTNISGATSATYTTPVVATTTYYRCAVTCTSSSTTVYSNVSTFTVSPLNAGATAASANNFACSSTVNLSLTGATTVGVTYQWYSAPDVSGSPGTYTAVSGATSATYAAGTVSASTWYYCAVTCTASSTTLSSTALKVTVNPVAGGTAAASPSSFACSATVALSLSGNTTTGVTYQWQSSPNNSTWANITGATAATYSATAVTSSTWYRCILTCTATSATSNSSSVQAVVTALTAGTTASTVSNFTCSTTGAVLSLTGANASTGVTRQWFSAPDVSGSPGTFTAISGATAATYTTGTISATTWYNCIITCTATSATATSTNLAVTALALVGGSAGAATNPACVGGTTALSLTGNSTAGMTYQWQSSPDNITYTNITGATGSTYTATVTANTYYKANLKCTASGATVNSSSILVNVNTGAVSSLPYTENFDGVVTPAIPCGWTALDIDADGNTWQTNNASSTFPPPAGGSSPNALFCRYNASNPNNDWAFSPTISLVGGNTYLVTFKYAAYSSGFTESLELKYGSGQNAAAMTNAVIAIPSFSSTSYSTSSVYITPSTSGSFNFGFHDYSITNQYGIFVDDFTITLLPNCSGTPSAGTTVSSVNPLCVGQSAILSLSGASTLFAGLSYQWQSRNPSGSGSFTNISGATSATYSASPISSTDYQCVLSCSYSSLSSNSTPVTVTTTNGLVTTFPYAENFDALTAPALPCGWTTADPTGNSPWITTALSETGGTGTNQATFESNCSTADNDWLFSPPMNFTLGTTYVLRFLKGSTYSSTEGLQVQWGNAPSVAGMTSGNVYSASFANSTMNSSGNVYLVPTVSGTYYIGFHAVSTAANSCFDYIAIDSISVTTQADCSGTPNPGNSAATISSIACPGTATTLSISGLTNVNGPSYTHRWQYSPTGLNQWSNITSGTGTTVTVSPNISYDYRDSVYCIGSGLYAYSTPVTVTVTGLQPQYAVLPYAQGFESWINGCSTTDRPDSFWIETPYTGNTAWRRYDQGASASWTVATDGAYTPQSNIGTYSARFHASDATSATTGSMDLYVNLTQPGAKQVTFYYISPIKKAAKNLKVLLSTDGGNSFQALATVFTNVAVTTWTLATINIPSTTITTANSVIRFQGTADANNVTSDDIGIDSINITAPCSGTPTAGVTASSVNTVCNGQAYTLSLIGADNTQGLAYQWQSSPNGVTWTNITGGTNVTLAYTAANSIITASTYYQCVVTCTNSSLSSTSTPVLVTFGNCAQMVKNTTRNFTTCAASIYDNGGPIANYAAATNTTSYNDYLTIYPATPGAFVQLTFDSLNFYEFDAYLYIYNGTNTSGTDLTGGGITGGMAASGNNCCLGLTLPATYTSTDPSGALTLYFNNGFIAGTYSGFHANAVCVSPCAGTPTAGSAVASPSSVCAGSTSTLTLTGNVPALNLSYQWQSSPHAAGTWTNITNDTFPAVTLGVATSTDFRCKITCNNSGLTAYSTSTNVTTTNAPTYASVPYFQSFESWINGCSTTDRPDASWVTTPSTGDDSWRRNDQGSSAAWVNNTSGAYSPTFTKGAYSARFHSYQAALGTTGNMDLYVNCTSSVPLQLNLDYINLSTSGNSLVILQSTDGGATFPTTLGTLSTSSAWSTHSYALTSTSATTVIRLFATSDYGVNDIGIDNFSIVPQLTISASQTVCGSSAVALSVTSLPLTNYNTYTWTPVTGLYTNSAATISYVAGSNASTVYALPSSTTIYKCTGTITTNNITSTAYTTVGVLSGTASGTNPVNCGNTGIINVSSASGLIGTTIYQSNFSTGSAGIATIGGSGAPSGDVINGGQLQLTDDVTSQYGYLRVPQSSNPNVIHTEFDMSITTPNFGGYADGLSYSFGTNVAPVSNTYENGFGYGLKICFMPYAHGTNDWQYGGTSNTGIYLVYGNSYVGATNSGVIAYNTNLTWEGATSHVTIDVDATGKATLKLGATVIFNNIQLPATWLTDNKSTWNYFIAARTGGVSESHVINNVFITSGNLELGINNANWQTSTVFSNLAAGSYTVNVRDASNTSCSATIATTTLANPSGPAAPVILPASPSICQGSIIALSATQTTVAKNEILYSENFNGGLGQFTVTNSSTGGGDLFHQVSAPYSNYTGSLSAYSIDGSSFIIADADNAGSGSVTVTTLVSPSISLKTSTAASLVFQHYYHYSSTDNTAEIDISTNGGSTWSVLKDYKALAVSQGSATTPARDSISLNSYLGNNIMVRFNYSSPYGFNWSIDNFVVKGNPIYGFTWSPTTSLFTNSAATTAYTNTSIKNLYAAPTSSIKYSSVVIDSLTGCVSVAGSDSITVSTPTLVINTPAAICTPATVDLTSASITAGSYAGAGSTGTFTYTYWTDTTATTSYASPSTATAGTYYIKATNSLGCYVIKPVTVTVNPTPTVVITNPATVCLPSTADLTAAAVTAGSTSGLTFTYWTDAAATISYTTPTAASAGTYYIKGTTALGCYNIQPVTVTSTSPPAATASSAGTYIPGQTINLVSGPSGQTSYAWSGPSAFTASSQNVSRTNATSTMSGTYTVTVTNSSGCSATASTVVVVNGLGDYTWTGATNTNWATVTNWTPTAPVGGPSGCSQNVIIPVVSNYPVISTATSIARITMNSGAQLTLNANLSVCQTFVGGTTSAATIIGTGHLVMAGTGAQTMSGLCNVDYLEINHTSTGLVSTATFNINKAMIMTKGAFSNNGSITLVSNASGDAYLDNFTSTTAGSMSNSLSVQRYIGNVADGYRDLSSPVATSVNDLNTAFPVFGQDNVDCWYAYSPYPNVQIFKEPLIIATGNFYEHWLSYTSLTKPLTAMIGYSARTYKGTPFTITFKGSAYNGAKSISITHTTSATPTSDGWNLLGNPYPSPIQWSLVKAMNGAVANGSYYVYHTTGEFTGNWGSYNGTTGVNGVTDLIAIGQGFFIQTATSGTFTMNNTVRTTGSASFYRTRALDNEIRLTLSKGVNSDEIVTYTEPGATAGFDADLDAQKIAAGSAVSIGYSLSGRDYAINAMDVITEQTVLPLTISGKETGSYTLTATTINVPGLTAYLLDSKTGSLTDLSTTASVQLSLTGGQTYAGRYSVVFQSNSASTGITATEASKTHIYAYGNQVHVIRSSANPATISVTNLLGQEIKEIPTNTEKTVFELPAVQPWYAIIKVTEGDKTTVSKVIISN